jgi:hypothetical protein
MQFIPMDLPAEMHRRAAGPSAAAKDVTVAKGPLVILAHGLMAIDPAERSNFWIASAAGRMNPTDVEAALHAWRSPRTN